MRSARKIRRDVRIGAVVVLVVWLATRRRREDAQRGGILGGGPAGGASRRSHGVVNAPYVRRRDPPARIPPPTRGAVETPPDARGTPVERDADGRPIVEVVLAPREDQAPPPGTVSASPELEPRHGRTPAGYDPAQAHAQAQGIAAHLARKGPRAYDRETLRRWQTLAGLHADGIYGGSSRGALIAYGVSDPPRPFAPPYATLPYVPPDSETEEDHP